ncbi:hypothetical protein OESDEN_01412 [Oesophagostomum dentatum]|uniref:Uncharacterized protein n=1 Tax=Oesophagostomum dentatum TaxID=61180 RepID=A0A0B1TMZ4_OESDE|nr:hypothetical protein OESDEN_01412 [Oesophagostomum dentatum]
MEEEDREIVEQLIRVGVPRVFRQRVNPLEILSDKEFRQRFRLTRRGFYTLLAMVKDDIQPTTIRKQQQ